MLCGAAAAHAVQRSGSSAFACADQPVNTSEAAAPSQHKRGGSTQSTQLRRQQPVNASEAAAPTCRRQTLTSVRLVTAVWAVATSSSSLSTRVGSLRGPRHKHSRLTQGLEPREAEDWQDEHRVPGCRVCSPQAVCKAMGRPAAAPRPAGARQKQGATTRHPPHPAARAWLQCRPPQTGQCSTRP